MATAYNACGVHWTPLTNIWKRDQSYLALDSLFTSLWCLEGALAPLYGKAYIQVYPGSTEWINGLTKKKNT